MGFDDFLSEKLELDDITIQQQIKVQPFDHLESHIYLKTINEHRKGKSPNKEQRDKMIAMAKGNALLLKILNMIYAAGVDQSQAGSKNNE